MGWGPPLGGVKYLGRPAWHLPSPGSQELLQEEDGLCGESGAREKKVKGRTQRLGSAPCAAPLTVPDR